MIQVWITTNNGEGFVHKLMTFEDLESVKIYTDVLGKGCQITLDQVCDKCEQIMCKCKQEVEK